MSCGIIHSNKYELWYYSFKVLVQLHYSIAVIVGKGCFGRHFLSQF
jgi:hypothetical protein